MGGGAHPLMRTLYVLKNVYGKMKEGGGSQLTTSSSAVWTSPPGLTMPAVTRSLEAGTTLYGSIEAARISLTALLSAGRPKRSFVLHAAHSVWDVR